MKDRAPGWVITSLLLTALYLLRNGLAAGGRIFLQTHFSFLLFGLISIIAGLSVVLVIRGRRVIRFSGLSGSVVLAPARVGFPYGRWSPLGALGLNPGYPGFGSRLGDTSRHLPFIRRVLDVFVSAIALVLAFPLLAVIGLCVRLGSHGPVLFFQERVGKDGKPFMMCKFRSMHRFAEPEGPALAVDGDARITRVGRILRKSRLDELPQLWNVLIGDMTLVGPRPERQFYIDRITDHAPNYARLLQLKPGLTSLGIVRFGYASSVDEMIDRQRHDQYYFENRSLGLDLLILLETVDVVLRRKGK